MLHATAVSQSSKGAVIRGSQALRLVRLAYLGMNSVASQHALAVQRR
jgi:hypothetical protein